MIIPTDNYIVNTVIAKKDKGNLRLFDSFKREFEIIF